MKRWSCHPKAVAARRQRWRKSLRLVWDRSERRWVKPDLDPLVAELRERLKNPALLYRKRDTPLTAAWWLWMFVESADDNVRDGMDVSEQEVYDLLVRLEAGRSAMTVIPFKRPANIESDIITEWGSVEETPWTCSAPAAGSLERPAARRLG